MNLKKRQASTPLLSGSAFEDPKPSPGPYVFDESNGFVTSADGEPILFVAAGRRNAETNGRFIARALNAYEPLLALARQYVSECGECAGVGITVEDEDCQECKFIRDVIAKAGP